jgi:hypothetical protein
VFLRGKGGNSPLVICASFSGGVVGSGVVQMAVSSAYERNSLNGGMIQIGDAQHSFSQDLEQLEQVCTGSRTSGARSKTSTTS